MNFFITCPKGIESLLALELETLGGQSIRQTVAGVEVSGDVVFAYRCCLWSRLANKVLLPMGHYAIESGDDLYGAARSIDWREHLRANGRLWIHFTGTNSHIRNSQFGAQKVKDAIVDTLRTSGGERPSIHQELPDLSVQARLHKGKVTISIDLTGGSLHRRGYRVTTVKAPLKENLAAALLMRANWPQLASQGYPFIDPMCGSGTLLIEAAMMAADIAPNINRDQFGFERWLPFERSHFEPIIDEARQRRAHGLTSAMAEIRGYDDNVLAIRASEKNSQAAGVDGFIHLLHKPLQTFSKPTHGDFSRGLLLTNPPYGERLSEQQQLIPLYQQLGDVLKRDFLGWQAGVLTSDRDLARAIKLRAHKKYRFFNGTIDSELSLYRIDEQQREAPVAKPPVLSPGAEMVANRLRKNQTKLKRWVQQQGVSCYRIYDADLPEYSAAIDCYEGRYHIQEYAPPKSVDPEKARQRLQEIQQAVMEVFTVSPAELSLKQRQRQKGKEQYQRHEEDAFARHFAVREGPATLWVNLHAYLDTGLFLDHRRVRAKVAELACGKRLLNLFCYTATATVQAALAGAHSSVSVDLSSTYLRWAQKNFDSNNLNRHHQLVRADCLTWLHDCREGFDVILLDPPSFSNSKRMTEVLDVQSDHPAMIRRCLELLKPGGTLVFSTNLQRFRLNYQALANARIEDISAHTVDRDFERNKKIHQCFLIQNQGYE